MNFATRDGGIEIEGNFMRIAIGIDVGGTDIKYGLVDEYGHILYESVRPTGSVRSAGSGRVLDNLKGAIGEMLDVATSGRLAVDGIGIGAPGIIDDDLIIGCGGNLPELEGLALGPLMTNIYQRPVAVDNDASLMGLAEAKWGAARNVSDVVFLTIGTGIGGAFIIDGKLYRGYRNRGAELGHIRVASGGRSCSCGASGCLEAQASIPALAADYRQLLWNSGQEAGPLIDGRQIVQHYLEGQPAAIEAMNLHFDYLASGIAGLINIFAPQKIIIGGGISEAGDFYISRLREKALGLAMKETSLYTVVEAAQLGNKAGLLGAAALVFTPPTL